MKFAKTHRLPFPPDSHGSGVFDVFGVVPWNSVGAFGHADGWWSAAVVVLECLLSRIASLC